MARKKNSSLKFSISDQQGDGKRQIIVQIDAPAAHFDVPESLSRHGLYPPLKNYLEAQLGELLNSFQSGAEERLETMRNSFSKPTN